MHLATAGSEQSSHPWPAPPDAGLSTHATLILSVLKAHGDLTVFECATFCSLRGHEIGKRMAELESAELARRATDDHGECIKRNSPMGKKAQVWTAK